MRKKVGMAETSWPVEDRALWRSALLLGDIFDEPGLAVRWRPKTVAQAKYAYGAWLQFISESSADALALPAADRITIERMRRYIDTLSLRLSPGSLGSALGHLVLALRAIAPTADVRWLNSLKRKTLAISTPRDKRPSMVAIEQLVELGWSLMSEAHSNGALVDPSAYRDGLIIALLSIRPLRRSNLAALRIARHLSIAGPELKISFEADEMKGHRAYECWIAAPLVDAILRYVHEVRPQLPEAATHDFLWCSNKGGALTADGIYQMISRRTEQRLGRRVYPHLFRDIAATTIATDQPESVCLSRDLLGHARIETTEKHYLHAQSVQAGKHYAGLISSLRSRRRVAARS